MSTTLPRVMEPPRPGSGAMFDGIASRYDLLNRLLSFGVDQRWRALTVRSLALSPHSKVLDVATGTGDLALRILREAPQISVTGLDPSIEMLRVFEAKARAASVLDRVAIQRGDAERLPFGERSFDAASIAFGIRNVPDRPAALREMARVVKPGGRIAILELSEPRSGPLSALAKFHIRTVVPWMGALLSGAAEYRYLQRSIAAFPPPEEFAELMRANRLHVIEVKPLTFGVACLFVAEVRP